MKNLPSPTLSAEKCQRFLTQNSCSIMSLNSSFIISPTPTYFQRNADNNAKEEKGGSNKNEEGNSDDSSGLLNLSEKTVNFTDFQKIRRSFTVYNRSQSLSFKPVNPVPCKKEDIFQDHLLLQSFKQPANSKSRTHNMKHLSKIAFEIIKDVPGMNFKDIARELCNRVEYLQIQQNQGDGSQNSCQKDQFKIKIQEGQSDKLKETLPKKYVAKNARRRLYDIFNVMRAANIIIQKGKSTFARDQFISERFQTDEHWKLKSSINKKQQAIKAKKQKERELKQKYERIKSLIHKNQTVITKDQNKIINFPFILIEAEGKVDHHNELQRFQVKSNKKIYFSADMDCLIKMHEDQS